MNSNKTVTNLDNDREEVVNAAQCVRTFKLSNGLAVTAYENHFADGSVLFTAEPVLEVSCSKGEKL